MLGLFPLISMFLVTSITMLRERTTGTLERLLTMPIAKLDLLLGYGARLRARRRGAGDGRVARGLRAARPRERQPAHRDRLLLAVANAVLGMALGLFVSAFAQTEFQAVQFMPAFVLPQILLCGLFVAREDMAEWLQALSALLPMTYAFDALDRAATQPDLDARFWLDVAVTLGATLLALALGRRHAAPPHPVGARPASPAVRPFSG